MVSNEHHAEAEEKGPPDTLAPDEHIHPHGFTSLESRLRNFHFFGRHTRRTVSSHSYQTLSTPFAGRLGGNQEFVLDRHDKTNDQILKNAPDASPGFSLKDQFDLRGFTRIALWKAASLEGMGMFCSLPSIFCPADCPSKGSLLLVYMTMWANIGPDSLPVPPTPQLGNFDNAAYLGPATGGLINFMFLSLFIFAFGVLTGGHLNPLITIGTFFARLTTFPRMVLYVSFQTLGGSLAGLLVRAGYGSRDFKVGGCWIFPSTYPIGRAFSNEFVASMTLLFLAFGVGLDPRQQKVIPPALSPFLVGLSLGAISWATGYTVYGYGGASLNPARCFGVSVGSHFHYWDWYGWVAAICACIAHGFFHTFVIPSVHIAGHTST